MHRLTTGTSAPRSAPTSPAERARSVLTAAGTAAVTALGAQRTCIPVWAMEHDGHLVLRPVEPSTVPRGLGHVRGAQPTEVEVADAAPVPAPDRVRARVRIVGSLVRDEADARLRWRCLPEEVFLDEGGTTRPVGLGALREARPDPLALVEGVMPAHLDSAHPDAVADLARLVDVRLLQGVTRVRPLRLDRHGLVLRLEYAGSARDVRVDFAAPVETPDGLTAAMRTLLVRARDLRRGCRWRREP